MTISLGLTAEVRCKSTYTLGSWACSPAFNDQQQWISRLTNFSTSLMHDKTWTATPAGLAGAVEIA
jgi:hypothetical protein